MIVNGKRRENFKVLNYKYSTLAYSPDANFIGNTGLITQGENDFGELEIDIYLESEDRDQMHREISEISKMFRICTVSFEDTSIEYVGTLNSLSVEQITPLHSRIAIVLNAYSRGLLVEIDLKESSNTIFIDGNMPCDVEYEFTPRGRKDTVKINDLQISNVQGGKKYLISGISKKVLADNENVFNSTNIFSFPRLAPGENTITVNHKDINLKLRYYPRFY